MTIQARLTFEGKAVLELLTHTKAARKHVSPYGLTPDPGPGLVLVKDDGIYLMSNGEAGLPETDTENKVVYALGYEALPFTADEEERMNRYNKVRNAVGGDDFAEFLPAKSFDRLVTAGLVEIELTASQLRIFFIGPPNSPSTQIAARLS